MEPASRAAANKLLTILKALQDSRELQTKQYDRFRHKRPLNGSQCWMSVRRLGREKKKNIENKGNALKKKVKPLKRQSTDSYRLKEI